MTVRFACSTRIAAPIEDVFDISLSVDAHAGSMARFHERAVSGIVRGQMGLDEEVTWRARHLGVSWVMTSRIVELERPTYFVDQQSKGPFAVFRHEHRFLPTEDGTHMLDAVVFDAPFGPIGWVAENGLRPYVRNLIVRRNRYLKAAAEHEPL